MELQKTSHQYLILVELSLHFGVRILVHRLKEGALQKPKSHQDIEVALLEIAATQNGHWATFLLNTESHITVPQRRRLIDVVIASQDAMCATSVLDTALIDFDQRKSLQGIAL